MAAFGSRVDSRKEVAYEYLCHLEEARKWVESVIKEALPDAQQWEYSLCNGICLCKLGAKLIPDLPVWKKVYDPDESRFKTRGLEYRHTDNINFFLLTLKKLGLPKVFHPSTVDVFQSKNIPQIIYCLHALSHFLKVRGSVKVPILDLYGKANFSEEVVSKISVQLEKSKKDLPAFGVVENLVEEELQYESMGLTVDTSDENVAHSANGTADAVGEITPPPAAAPHLSSPKVASVANGSQSSTTTAPKIDLKSLFDDPSYAELQSMIEDMEKLGESFNLLSPIPEPEPTVTASESAVARSISPPVTAAINFDEEGAASRVSPVVEYTCKDSDVKAAVYSTVDKFKKKKRSISAIDTTISDVDEAVEFADPVETVKKLKAAATVNKMAYVFTDIKFANLYHEALKKEKSFGMPNSAVVIFRGINRDKCEKMLEKMSPGAYILRACPDSNMEFVFSYRNQTGTKHWKIAPTNGKYTWGNSPKYENIEDFIENFARCLSSATKLKVYPGMTTNLQPEQSEVDGVREKLDDDSSSERPLTREQINRVIVEVNSTISGLKRAEKPETSPPPLPNKPSSKWTSQNVRKISRYDAESMLEQHGRPGSFLVRPSETEPGGYAIVFRTKEDMKRWKIVTKDGQFMVHPRPQKYPTLEAVIEVFIKGLKDHTGLDMVQLDISEDQPVRSPVAMQPRELPILVAKQPPANSKQPSPAAHSISSSSREVSPLMSSGSSTEEVTYSRLNFNKAKRQDDIPEPPMAGTQSYSVVSKHDSSPSRSLSKLNPHNVTSWSVEDVTQWLIGEGLGQFIEEFKENVVDGECLINLDLAQLRDDLGIKALGHRHRLMKKINKVKEDCGLPTS